MLGVLRWLSVLCIVVVAGCSKGHPEGPPAGTEAEIAELEAAILALGPEVDPVEAAHAARLTYETTFRLSREYQITDSPLVHNTKVNLGTKPRGLCWHWSVDLGAVLEAQNYQTLDVHYAIANAFNPILIEHSTTLISRKGDEMEQAIIVDPWREGGVLFWAPFAEDTRYNWVRRAGSLG